METNNKLIAKFIGLGAQLHLVEHPETGEYVEAEFHNSWDWLMPVVEKIESLGNYVEIRDNVCYIETSKDNYISELESSKLLSTYKAVVKFIKWYNKQL